MGLNWPTHAGELEGGTRRMASDWWCDTSESADWRFQGVTRHLELHMRAGSEIARGQHALRMPKRMHRADGTGMEARGETGGAASGRKPAETTVSAVLRWRSAGWRASGGGYQGGITQGIR